MRIDHLCNLFVDGEGRWCGCDWDTTFGSLRLNLQSVLARQAEIAAKATAGEESNCWREAATWLRTVERDAALAEREAALAVKAAIANCLVDAQQHIAIACAIEARYPEHQPIWEALRRALEQPPEHPPPGSTKRRSLPIYLFFPIQSPSHVAC